MKVTRVQPKSEAELAGIRPGDELMSVDGRAVEDSVDVAFAIGWADAEEIDYVLERDGSRRTLRLDARDVSALGLELEEPPPRTCGNSCVFCFVDQLPSGLRLGLYVKDEDFRLSFTHGNYITLTNLSDSDYNRIAEQRLSPLYISVHSTDDVIRRSMLGNARAPAILPSMRRLADSGIVMHTQIVLCPGLNDGAVLDRTIGDLEELGGAVASIAVVPVGLTAHRQGLPSVRAVSADDAAAALSTILAWQGRFEEDRDSATVYAADELYLLAGQPLPPYEHYGDFPQLENGVGMLRSFEHRLASAVGEPARKDFAAHGSATGNLTVTVLTGRLAASFVERALSDSLGAATGLRFRVVPVDNTLLGPSVTVAGLMSGKDMAGALGSVPDDGPALLPAEAFNAGGLTLDGLSVVDIRRDSGREDVTVAGDIVETVMALFAARPEANGSRRHEATESAEPGF